MAIGRSREVARRLVERDTSRSALPMLEAALKPAEDFPENKNNFMESNLFKHANENIKKGARLLTCSHCISRMRNTPVLTREP